MLLEMIDEDFDEIGIPRDQVHNTNFHFSRFKAALSLFSYIHLIPSLPGIARYPCSAPKNAS
jgi:hypothetical protein